MEATGGLEPPNRGFAVLSELSGKVHGRSLLSSNSAKSIHQRLPVTATVHPGWLSMWLSSLALILRQQSRIRNFLRSPGAYRQIVVVVRQKKLTKNLPVKSVSPINSQNYTGIAESYIYWSNLAKWSRKKGLFEPWERRLCYLISRRLLRKDDLTEGMIRHRDRIIAEATRSGFEG